MEKWMTRITALEGLFGPDPATATKEQGEFLLANGGVTPKDDDSIADQFRDAVDTFLADPHLVAAAEPNDGRKAVYAWLAEQVAPKAANPVTVDPSEPPEAIGGGTRVRPVVAAAGARGGRGGADPGAPRDAGVPPADPAAVEAARVREEEARAARHAALAEEIGEGLRATATPVVRPAVTATDARPKSGPQVHVMTEEELANYGKKAHGHGDHGHAKPGETAGVLKVAFYGCGGLMVLATLLVILLWWLIG